MILALLVGAIVVPVVISHPHVLHLGVDAWMYKANLTFVQVALPNKGVVHLLKIK